MAAATIYISRIDADQNDFVSIEAHYTTNTGVSGSRSVEVSSYLSGDLMEEAVINEIKRHCSAKWGVTVDWVVLCGRIKTG